MVNNTLYDTILLSDNQIHDGHREWLKNLFDKHSSSKPITRIRSWNFYTNELSLNT